MQSQRIENIDLTDSIRGCPPYSPLPPSQTLIQNQTLPSLSSHPRLKSHPQHLLCVRGGMRGLNNIPQTICQRAVSVRPPGLLIRKDKRNITTDFCFPSSLYIPSTSPLFTSLHFHSFQSVFHFLSLLSGLLAICGGSKLILE